MTRAPITISFPLAPASNSLTPTFAAFFLSMNNPPCASSCTSPALAFYRALGQDTLTPNAGRRVSVNAHMAAAEISFDKDWIRSRVSAFYTSGDANPRDGRARGFDSIVDLPNFAGGLFSFWNREGIRLLGSGVLLTTPGSLIPSLRSSKAEGQANFVNPEIFIATTGADFDITPTLRGFANLNF